MRMIHYVMAGTWLRIASLLMLSNIASYSAFSQYGVTETEARAAYCIGAMNREIGTLQKARHAAPTKSIEEPWHSLGQQLVADERVRKRYLLYLHLTGALPDLSRPGTPEGLMFASLRGTEEMTACQTAEAACLSTTGKCIGTPTACAGPEQCRDASRLLPFRFDQ